MLFDRGYSGIKCRMQRAIIFGNYADSGGKIRSLKSRFRFSYSESSTTARMNQPDLEVNAPIVDMDLHFDIDVDPVEPPNVLEPTLPQIGISFSEDDRNALRRCSVLLPNISIADDLRPISSTPLAYSYRRLTNADLPGDAGDHWKLPSIVQSNSSENGENPRSDSSFVF